MADGRVADGRVAAGYLRYPHIHGELVAFVAADDVWVVPADGGRAWRLTDDRAPARTPRFSPDGGQLAYVSHRDGHPEVMVVDLAGGSARRLTWWGATTTLVLGWTADGRVLAASHAGQSQIRDLVVRAVALDGTVEQLRYGPAWGLAVRADGVVALSSVGSRTPAHWKRYRGGTAPRLWLESDGKGAWQRLLPDEPAALVDPMWIGDALAFVSDRAAAFPDRADEQANLWVWDEVGSDQPRQVTRQGAAEGYVRDASTDGARITWHSRGRLWVLEALDAEPRVLDITLPGGTPTAFSATSTEHLDRLVPDRGGDASLVGWRGTAYLLTHRDGPARALAATPGVRVREPQLLGPDHAVVVTDSEGEDALQVVSVKGEDEPRTLAVDKLGRVLHLATDSAGSQIATISHDGTIRLIDPSNGRPRELARSPDGEAESLTFSPDGRYLLWSQPTAAEGTIHQLMLAETREGGPGRPLTSGRFHDHSPAFTLDGKHVVFLSDRTFDPTYDTHEFALSFSGSTRPWLIPLAATEPPPFGPSADGWRISKPEPEHGSGPAGEVADRPPPPPEPSPDADLDGAEQRIVPFPVSSGDYRKLRPAKEGVLWIREAAEVGTLGSRRAWVSGEPTADTLEHWSFPLRKATTVADAVSDYAVSGDGERVVVRVKDELTLQPAARKPEEDDDPEVVKIDLGRLRLQVDPRAEWRQMYAENARIMRDHFWREDMDGVDWAEVTERWAPVVDQLATHDDLVDLLWEVGGELNTSHAYVTPATPPGDQDRRLGLLGVDLSPADGGWRIDRILPGESSDPKARSPLQAAGVDAREGDLIVAVDGHPVDPAVGPAARLVGATEKPVELTLRRAGRGQRDRRVVVVPLADEEELRYQAWVASRRDYVRERTDGRLGYVHVPDMMGKGWAQLHRDLRAATRAEGLVLDVRYNRGGHTSQLVIDRIARRVIAWGRGRHYAQDGTYPDAARRGPVTLVANRYSGSDGDIVNAAAQAMQLGPVVGERTWGGVVGIDGRFDLVDGTAITQPRYATWLQGKEWGVENYGVDPDIEVIERPGDFFGSDDRQLDRAIEELLAQLAQTPATAPPPMPRPKVRPAH